MNGMKRLMVFLGLVALAGAPLFGGGVYKALVEGVTYRYSFAGMTTVCLGVENADAVTEIAIGLGVVGDVVIGEGARLTVGGFDLRRPSVVSVGGTLLAEADSSFQVYGGPTNATTITLQTGGGRVSVLGEIRLAAGATMTFFPHLVTEDYHSFGRLGPVVLDVGTLDLAEGASIVSHAGSSLRTLDHRGKSDHSDFCAGGGHGGVGGESGAGNAGGQTYGNPFAPVLPGYFGREIANFGGGVIRIVADSVRLAGTIDVTPLYYGQRYEQGGGSGGSIWITANQWSVAPTAVLRARGQKAEPLWGTGNHSCGGGGGGRIALGRNLTDEDIDSLYATGDVVRRVVKKDLLTTPVGFIRGTIDVSGGDPSNAGKIGGTGTAWLLDATPSGTILLLR